MDSTYFFTHRMKNENHEKMCHGKKKMCHDGVMKKNDKMMLS